MGQHQPPDSVEQHRLHNCCSYNITSTSVQHCYACTIVDTTPVHHGRARELSFPLNIHAVVRSRSLIDTLFSLGLCLSYDKLIHLTTDIANGVCQHFNMEEGVCSPKMCQRLLTIGSVDNIDQITSSATAKDSYHGTGISLIIIHTYIYIYIYIAHYSHCVLMQHPSHTNDGLSRGVVVSWQYISPVKSVTSLPVEYTPVAMKMHHFTTHDVQWPASACLAEDSEDRS